MEKNNKKGITLISLVITIVIMLILAGVSVSFLVGNNGLIKKVQESKYQSTIARYKEDINTSMGEASIDINDDHTKSYAEYLVSDFNSLSWVDNIMSEKEDDKTATDAMILLISKEGYKLYVSVDNMKETANITVGNSDENDKYTISYDGNGAESGEAQSKEVYKGFSVTLSENNFIKTGYKFVGWSVSKTDGEVILAGEKFKSDVDVTLYAQWESQLCTVTFNSNGGTGTMNSVQMACGVATKLPAVTYEYSNDAKHFGNWSTQSNGGGQTYTNESNIIINGDTVLYATWYDHYYSEPSNICTVGQNVKCGGCGHVEYMAAKGHNFVNGRCLRCGATVKKAADYTMAQMVKSTAGSDATRSGYPITNLYNGNENDNVMSNSGNKYTAYLDFRELYLCKSVRLACNWYKDIGAQSTANMNVYGKKQDGTWERCLTGNIMSKTTGVTSSTNFPNERYYSAIKVEVTLKDLSLAAISEVTIK